MYEPHPLPVGDHLPIGMSQRSSSVSSHTNNADTTTGISCILFYTFQWSVCYESVCRRAPVLCELPTQNGAVLRPAYDPQRSTVLGRNWHAGTKVQATV